MKILALDTGQKSCSVALMEDDLLIAEENDTAGQTHSRTLLAMVERLFARAGWRAQELGLYAVTVGPGSFTGLRIGISAVKGLCFTQQTPVAPVSGLEALAENTPGEGFFAAAMDARQDRVFGALFERQKGKLIRLTEDGVFPTAAFLEAVCEKTGKNRAVFVGDGAEMCYNSKNGLELVERIEQQPLRASSVGACGLRLFRQGLTCSAEQLCPAYYQKPKAERMREEAGQSGENRKKVERSI